MHVGRLYPYLPKYWATECWFWPGFVPWKFYGLLIGGTPAPPWDVMSGIWGAFSDAGGTVLDCTQAYWNFLVQADEGVYTLKLSMEEIVREGVPLCRTKLQLKNGAVELANAWLYQPYPQFQIDLENKNFSMSDTVVAVPPYLTINFRPAVFSEVGSPFPNY